MIIFVLEIVKKSGSYRCAVALKPLGIFEWQIQRRRGLNALILVPPCHPCVPFVGMHINLLQPEKGTGIITFVHMFEIDF
jgi:hypothetical protein